MEFQFPGMNCIPVLGNVPKVARKLELKNNDGEINTIHSRGICPDTRNPALINLNELSFSIYPKDFFENLKKKMLLNNDEIK